MDTKNYSNVKNNRKKVLFIITGLQVGGAEKSLLKVVQGLRDQYAFHVISLSDKGQVAKELQELGIPVESLDLQSSFQVPWGLVKLYIRIRKIRPDVVKTWMYHADFLGGIAAKLARIKIVFWGVRHSDLTTNGVKRGTRLVARVNAILSDSLPTKIVYNSRRGIELHHSMGFSRKNSVFIPNGFDCSIFKFSMVARNSFRSRHNIDASCQVVGLIARYDPLKNHFGFIEAASYILRELPKTVFVMAGRGVDEHNEEINRELYSLGIHHNFRLLGEVNELPEVYSALDILGLSSISESFPNVVGEAMACGVRCVSTDVGDAREIIGETGIVVPPNDMIGLAKGILKFLHDMSLLQESYSDLARQRIVDLFNNSKNLEKFSALFRQQI
jgi:glycosyltransferase involved in cell wall biosynthesis